jgi:transposase
VIEIVFTEKAVAELQDISGHHVHPFVRRKALALLLKSQKIAHQTIAKITNVCENTVRTYFKDYLADGISSITTIEFNRPESELKKFEDIIREYIKKSPPATIKQACVEIGALTGIVVKETQMRKYFQFLGVKCRKVTGIPAKANPAAQKEFLETKLQPRLDEAEKGKRKVYFVDAAHFVFGSFLGYLWSFARVLIPTPNGRQRFNVLGALDAISKEMLTITNVTYITSIQVCELLEKIAQKSVDPVTNALVSTTVVLDNARYQRCKLVQEKATVLGIELLFLPPYSPNLNLIERMWKFTKKETLNSKYYANFLLFKSAISDFLETMHSKHSSRLQTLLALNFQLFE